MFHVYEVCKCKVLVYLSNFSLLIDQTPNLNILKYANKMTRHEMMRNIYSSNNNRSYNRHCMHLFICQLILRIFKLEFANGLL